KEGASKVNLPVRGIAASAVLLLAVLSAATVLSNPIQPPRTFSGAASDVALVMPSDPPVIRDGPRIYPGAASTVSLVMPNDSPIIRDGSVETMCTGTPDCNGGP